MGPWEVCWAWKPRSPGGEVELLVVEGVVGDVHLAVLGGEGAVGFQDGYGVVVEAGGAALEEAGDDDYFFFFGDCGQRLGRGAGDGLGGVEEGVLFALAEVLGAEEFGEADDVGSGAGCVAGEGDGFGEVLGGVYGAGHLDEGDLFVGGGHGVPRMLWSRVRNTAGLGF